VRDLDDPENPYAGQYGPWDYWMREHPGMPELELRQQLFAGALPDNKLWRMVSVDDQGFPLPYLLDMEQGLQMNTAGSKPESSCKLSYDCWGEMPEEMFWDFDQQETRLWAKYAASIPGWLAVSPPISARIWPDGRVTTHGELGSYAGNSGLILVDASTMKYTPEPYCLYSADGELLRMTEENEWEDDLFLGDFDLSDVLQALFYESWKTKARARAKARGWHPGMAIENDYYLVYSRGRKQVMEVYDIDGTRYEADFNWWARDGNKFCTLGGDELTQLYGIQRELGLTE